MIKFYPTALAAALLATVTSFSLALAMFPAAVLTA